MIVGLVRSLRVKRCLGWSAINTRGVIGGILVYQNSRVMKLVGLEMRAFSISCRFKNCEDGVVLVFISVYGQVCRREKKNLQDELGATRGLRSDPWCVDRDFNMISFLGEQQGRRVILSHEEIFRLDRGVGVERHFSMGGPFTWRGGLNNQS